MLGDEPAGQRGARGNGRLMRGVLALATLLGMLLGVPTALLAFGGDPLPRGVPSLSGTVRTLTTADRTGHLVIMVALWVAWLAWLAFTTSVLVEVVARLHNRPATRLPGLRSLQRLAAGLLTAVALLAGVSGTAIPVYAAAPPSVASTVVRVPASASTLVYRVAAGDSLGTVAARMFGRTDDYTRILAQNWELLDQTAGPNQPDALREGWLVRLPAGARDRGPRPGADGTVLTPDALAHLVHAMAVEPPTAAELAGLAGVPATTGLAGSALDTAVLATGVPTAVAPGVTVTISDTGAVVGVGTGAPADTYASTLPRRPVAPAGDAGLAATPHAATTATVATPRVATVAQQYQQIQQARQAAMAAARAVVEQAKGTSPANQQQARATAADIRQRAQEAAKQAREQVREGRTSPPPGGTAPGGTNQHRGRPTASPAHGPASRAPVIAPTPGDPSQMPADPIAPTPVIMWDPVPNPATEAGQHPAGGHHDPALLLVAGGVGFAALGAHLAARRRRRQIVRGPAAALTSGSGHPPALPDPDLDFDRLDLALRDLATLLGGRDNGPLPDIIGSWLVDGSVHLLLTKPCPAPAPWIAHGLRWTLPAHAPAHAYFSGVTAPLPALVTVGGAEDQRIFLDLERLGVVTVGGDPQGAADLLRHVGAELCSGIWSDGVTIGIAGFTQEDTRQLVALGDGRVHAMDSIPDALDTAVRWVDDAQARLRGLGAYDVLSARVTASPAVAARLSPYALLLAGPDAADMERLHRLDAYLAGRGRGQVAVVATTQVRLGRWPMQVDADRQVTMEFLDARVPAVSLAGAELAALAVAPERPHPRAADQDVPVGRHRAHRVGV